MANVLKKWLEKATREETKTLAIKAGTTVESLRQLAGGFRTGGAVRATPERARNLELASKKMPHLPLLLREDMCPACKKCEYSKGKTK